MNYIENDDRINIVLSSFPPLRGFLKFMDLAYPLSVVNGDIETIENATASQIRSYASIYQGESVLEPAFGRVTHPMSSSNRSPGLLAELERLNAKKYFADIQNIQFRGRFQDKKFILEITF